jgi:uncharacterized protein (DUF1015 family)
MPEKYTKPFRGIVYNKEKAGDIASCVCPPYDVVSDVRSYYKKNEFNAIRLELPESLPSMDKYNAAKHTMDEWLHKGVLELDGKDTVYVYEQRFDVEGNSFLRRGFIALNKLDRGRILTHEETRKKAKEDRERLITTLKTYTSLIFGLYEDKNNEIEDILISARKDIMYDFIDEQAINNRFYRMTDGREIARLSALMDEKNIYIADGHHRLDVSYKLKIPYIPLYLTNMYSSGIVILPYHRVIKFSGSRNIKDLLNSIRGYIEIEKCSLANDNSIKKALKDISESENLAFVLCSKDDPENLYILKEKTPIPMDNDLHESLRMLKVNVVHTGALKHLFKISDEEISFTQDPFESINSIKDGSIDLAVFLPPTTVREVKSIADNSLFMPPKSTFFYPKILTGLVFYKYA